MNADGQRAAIRRVLGWILVGALCISALTAIVAILGGEFDDTDWRVIGNSIGFAVYSALGGTGASLRLRASGRLQALGLLTVVLAAVGFLLLLPVIWSDESGETLVRWWGAVSLAALASSHASLMTGGFRDTDSGLVRLLAITSITLVSLEAFGGILAIAEAFEEVDEGEAQAGAVLLVLMLLSTALTPIVRRLEQNRPTRPEVAPATTLGAPATTQSAPATTLSAEVIAAADRLEALNADPGNRAPEIRREVQRLRELARAHSRE